MACDDQARTTGFGTNHRNRSAGAEPLTCLEMSKGIPIELPQCERWHSRASTSAAIPVLQQW